MPLPRLPLGATVALLMLTQTFGWGVNVNLIGVIAAPAGADLGLSPAAVYGGATVLFLTAALVGPFIGRRVDGWGGARVMAAGCLFQAAGLAVMGLAQGVAGWALAWALLGVASHAALATAAYGFLIQQAREEGAARRAIGMLALATGLCATVMWPVSSALMGAVGWRAMCAVYAAVTVALVLPANLLLVAGSRAAPAAPAAVAPGPVRPVSGRPFLLVATIHAVGIVIGTTAMVMLIDIFTAYGTPRDQAVRAASLVGIAYLVSRGVEVGLGARLPPVRLAALVMAAMAAACLPLSLWPAGVPLPGWVAAGVALAYGLPAGLLSILRPTLPRAIFGATAYGGTMGRLARPGDLCNAAAPAVLAAVLGVSHRAAVGTFIALSLVALVAALLLARDQSSSSSSASG